MSTPITFNGSIPQHYEDYLTPFLFDKFSNDIAKRVLYSKDSNILELASGTGSVTQYLVKHLPESAQLTASDLEEGMLQVARKKTEAPNLRWATVDMTAIPFEDNHFDIIVSQFGLMLVPDKLKALQEMHRVLKPGGQLLFSVWGDINANQIWNIGGNVIESFLGINPILQNPGPFSMNENNTMPLLNEAGFNKITTHIVHQSGNIESAELATKGFIEGLPIILAISKKAPSLLPQIYKTLEAELNGQLGNHPLQTSLQAIVFEVFK